MIPRVESRTVIRLIRHGESTWNAAGRVQGQSASAGTLTARGTREAQRAGEELAALSPGPRVVVSSDLPRALDTAAVVAARLQLGVERDLGLREQALGDLEGRGPGPDVAAEIERLWREPERRPAGGESVAELYARILDTLIGIAERWPGDTVIAVTHGGPVRVAVAACAGGVREIRRTAVANATVYSVEVRRSDAGLAGIAALAAASDV